MKRITVFGATGMLGKPVTIELLNAGYEVTALVRNVEKASRELPEGIHLVEGDLQNTNAIKEVLEGAEGVYISIANTYKDKENQFNAEHHGLDNILRVAKQCNIKQVSLLSSFLARNYQGDWWIFKNKKSCIDRIKGSGVPYTIFYASSFMENITSGMLRGNSVSTVKSELNNKSFWISARDFGKQVANAFNTDQALNNEYAAQGLKDFTMEEAAIEYAKHYSKAKLKVSFTPRWIMTTLSVFNPMIKFMAKMSEVNISTNETFEAQKTWNELGQPTTTISLFAQNS